MTDKIDALSEQLRSFVQQNTNQKGNKKKRKKGNDNIGDNESDRNTPSKLPKSGTDNHLSSTNDDFDMKNTDEDSDIDSLNENNANHRQIVNNDITTNIGAIINDNWADITTNDGPSNTSKTTPIQLGKYSGEKYSELINSLFKEFNGSGYTWCPLRINSPPRILTHDEDTKRKMVNFLQTNGWEFNSYAEKNQKRKAYIVRGFLYGNDGGNINGIYTALDAAGISNGVIVTRFLTGYQKRNPDEKHNQLYQVTLDNNIDDSILGKIKTINSFSIKFEKMKNSPTIQCKRCQRYSHAAGQCKFEYRCVQCINKHAPGECPRMKNKRLPIGCINCADEKLNHRGHTANDLQNCGYFNKTSSKAKAKANPKDRKPSPPKQTGGGGKDFINPAGLSNNTEARQTENISKKRERKLITKYR